MKQTSLAPSLSSCSSRLGARCAGALFAALAVFVAAPSTAHAAPGSRLGVDLDYINDINEDFSEAGKGVALRYGYKLDLLVLSVTPEVGLGGYWFGGAADPRILQGFVGGRATFGKVLEPGVFAHLGYGSMKVLDESRGGTSIDAGVTLDLTMLPFIDLGVHAAYDAFLVKDEDAFDWFRVGAHAALAF
ncbi:MAG TPA: hypothetical protein VFQ35_03835 [Polyangiaceae bacterium]|nr:hypothetical protein [Polyangiaceae bacterium]